MGLVQLLKLNRKALGQTPWARNQARIRRQPAADILDVGVHPEYLPNRHRHKPRGQIRPWRLQRGGGKGIEGGRGLHRRPWITDSPLRTWQRSKVTLALT